MSRRPPPPSSSSFSPSPSPPFQQPLTARRPSPAPATIRPSSGVGRGRPTPSSASPLSPPATSSSNRAAPQPSGPLTTTPSLKLVWLHSDGSDAGGGTAAADDDDDDRVMGSGVDEWALRDAKVSIGRHRSCTVCLHTDGQVSSFHAEIVNAFITDLHSTNGTTVNHQPLLERKATRLRAGDVIRCGTTELRVEVGEVQGRSVASLSRSKQFPAAGPLHTPAQSDGRKAAAGDEEGRAQVGGRPQAGEEHKEKEPPVDASAAVQSVEEMMDAEFARIIGHEELKLQLRQFYKKVQLDRIRQAHGKEMDRQRLYHMIFSGPPGTGKTTMANVVSKLLLRMQLVQSSNVVFVNNSLELLGSYVGQTPMKVDAKVQEAAGGVLFIDEAYSIVKEGGGREGSGASFGKEAIDTLMKHMDPPSCVMIFAGYSKEMEDFLTVNSGLARRIPYRYTFHAYTQPQLMQIFLVMCKAKGETLGEGVEDEFPRLLSGVDDGWLSLQNAGLISNWLSFAQMERDDRIDLSEAELQPSLASTLDMQDLVRALPALDKMKPSNSSHQQQPSAPHRSAAVTRLASGT